MVQDQLGHESILTTRKVYGALQPAMMAQLAEASTRAMALGAPPAQIEG
jgi:integrase